MAELTPSPTPASPEPAASEVEGVTPAPPSAMPQASPQQVQQHQEQNQDQTDTQTQQQPPPAPVEVDDEDDPESAFGDDDASRASTSLASVRSAYEWKHGRRYHGYRSGKYSFPNDEDEQDRLDMIHRVFYLVMYDRLYVAPIDTRGLSVLDIGTGTGIWPIQFGDEHPEAELIVGNDLSAIQPEWVPNNVRFVVDDVELEWIEPQKYDYIHCRYMAGSIKDWPRLVSQVYDNLKPGGWFEFQESANTLYSEDDTLKPDDPMVQMMDGLMEACELIGRTMDPAPSMKQWVQAAGFENVSEEKFKLPIGSWPKDPRYKEIGSLMKVNFLEGVEAFTAALFKDVLGWTREEVIVLNAGVRAAVRNNDVHPMFDFIVVIGQKPMTDEEED
ncbi:Secondary metabolism regulator LAE1 [Colletotrichum sidae]|uniref:Secondary metabolism regulator LAE1 n=1 Tax=Colletotrichum sidae TaxID=1347389 RepID=A0A4R8T0Q2_9PEZI|nr:Secondary metabolism regulator LAE1 [Colletotrichum sidae]